MNLKTGSIFVLSLMTHVTRKVDSQQYLRPKDVLLIKPNTATRFFYSKNHFFFDRAVISQGALD